MVDSLTMAAGAVIVWLSVLCARFQHGVRRREPFYHRHARRIVLLALALFGSFIYLFFFHLGEFIIQYLQYPIFLTLCGIILRTLHLRLPGLMLQSIALAQVSLMPAAYLSMSRLPLFIAFSCTVIGLGALFFLIMLQSQREAGRLSMLHLLILGSLLCTMMLVKIPTSQPEHQLSIATIVSTIALAVVSHAARRTTPTVYSSLLWPVMSLPPLIIMLLLP